MTEKFKVLGLKDALLRSIIEHKFEAPSEIQEKTIPLVLDGKDVIAGASTGSGKTLAFGSGIIQNCEKIGVVQALILVPTRELADQVAKTLKMFSRYKPLEIVEVFGGVSMSPQVQKLRRADVVVGTPGRLLDHLEHETIDLRYVKILVLDEADRMLDMGFVQDVTRIIENCPKNRQTLLFSATINQDVKKLSHRYMHNPTEIAAEAQVDPTKLKQVYYDVPDNMKFSLLVHLLKQNRVGLAMVFCNTQRNTDFVAQNLQQVGINALAIHGGHSQDKRTRVMNQFHAQDFEVLVCTDVAARGLDIKNVSHVYNYDIPREPNQYVHRIGRTARAGTEGIAINILASRDYDNFTQVRRHNPDLRIEKEEVPQIERVMIRVKDQEFRGGGRYGGRGDSRGGHGGGFRGRPSSSGGFRGRSDRNSGGFRRRDDNRPRSRFGRR